MDEYGISLIIEKDEDCVEFKDDDDEKSLESVPRSLKSGERSSIRSSDTKDKNDSVKNDRNGNSDRGSARGKDRDECKDDKGKDREDRNKDKGKDRDDDKGEFKDESKDTDEIEYSGLEKFFVKPASEFIVDFFDAFSNIDDGGVALMMEYMDGAYLCTVIAF